MNIDHEKLRNAQSDIDFQRKHYREKIAKQNNDTSMAIIHLNENLEWYKYKSLDVYSGRRQNWIVSRLRNYFPNLDENILRRKLSRSGILTTFQVAVLLNSLIISLSVVICYCINYEDPIFYIIYALGTIIPCSIFTAIICTTYSESYWMRFFRIRKDL